MAIGPGQPLIFCCLRAFIVFFCFFYTALMFNPQEVADNLKRSGAFVPGIRPGQQTANYIDGVLTTIDGVWFGLHRVSLPAAAVFGRDVQRALLLGRHLNADCGGCGDGFYGPSTKSSNVTPI